MTRHDGEPEADATTGSADQPPSRSAASDTTGTWAFISPFAASPGSYVPSSATPDQPTSGPVDQPNTHGGAGPEPTPTSGRPAWAPAAQPGWENSATGAVGGGSWTPGAPASQPPNEPPTWGTPAAPNMPSTWGAPAVADPERTPPSRWKTWQKVTAGGVLAGVVALGGVAAVSAANASSSSDTSQAGFAGGSPGSGSGEAGGTGGGLRGGMAGAMALANALHGDFVVSAGSGTQTMRLQSGELTTVAADSITVASTDGYTSTYAIGSGVDVSGLAQGDTVRVIATVDGDTAMASSVTSGTTGSANGFGGAGQGQSGPGRGEAGMQPPEGMQLPEGVTPPNESGQAPQTS